MSGVIPSIPASAVVVLIGDFTADLDELVEPAELHDADGRVQLAHSPGVAQSDVVAAEEPGLALVAVDEGLVADALVGGDDHAALAVGHHLGGVEGERARRRRTSPPAARRGSTPWAWAASSTRNNPRRSHRVADRVDLGRDRPADVHEDDAGRVLAQARLRPCSADRASVSGATSAKRGVPPAWSTAAAVAKNVFVGTTTSRPSTPIVRRMISIALVPLLTATANGASWPGSERVLELARVRAEGQRAGLQRLVDHREDRGAVLVGEDEPCCRYVPRQPSSAITAHGVNVEVRGLARSGAAPTRCSLQASSPSTDIWSRSACSLVW